MDFKIYYFFIFLISLITNISSKIKIDKILPWSEEQMSINLLIMFSKLCIKHVKPEHLKPCRKFSKVFTYNIK